MIGGNEHIPGTKNMYMDIYTYFPSKYHFHHYSINTHNLLMISLLCLSAHGSEQKEINLYWYTYHHCLWVYTVIYWNLQKLMFTNINETTVCSWYMYFLLWLTSNISWRLILIKEGLPLAHLQFSLGAEESFYKTVCTHYSKITDFKFYIV